MNDLIKTCGALFMKDHLYRVHIYDDIRIYQLSNCSIFNTRQKKKVRPQSIQSVYGCNRMRGLIVFSCIVSRRISLHQCKLQRIVSHGMASHRIVSHRIASHHITSHHMTSHHITSHHLTSHRIASHRTAKYHIASQCVTTCTKILRYKSHHIMIYIMLHRMTSHHIALLRIISYHTNITSHQIISWS